MRTESYKLSSAVDNYQGAAFLIVHVACCDLNLFEYLPYAWVESSPRNQMQIVTLTILWTRLLLPICRGRRYSYFIASEACPTDTCVTPLQ